MKDRINLVADPIISALYHSKNLFKVQPLSPTTIQQFTYLFRNIT